MTCALGPAPVTTATSSPFVPLHNDVVGREVVSSADGGQVGHHADDIGPGEVVDDEVVEAAERIRDDRLDVVEVHRDTGDVTEESHPVAYGGDVHDLIGVVAVERHRVVAGLAFEGVAVVARVPDERVVAGAHEGHVITVTTDDQIVALTAEEQVRAEATVHRELDAIGFQRCGVHGVRTAQGVERQPVVGLLGGEDGDRGLESEDLDPARGTRGTEHVVAVGAVDRDGVGLAVAAAGGPAQVEADLRHVRPAQVTLGDVVGAAQGPEVNALDVVEVHRHVGHVAEERARPPLATMSMFSLASEPKKSIVSVPA